VDDGVGMAIFKRRADLAGKLPRTPLPQTAVTDDIVKHLTSVDILGYHEIVVRIDEHALHAADIRMEE
jgi:hypothetical protein